LSFYEAIPSYQKVIAPEGLASNFKATWMPVQAM